MNWTTYNFKIQSMNKVHYLEKWDDCGNCVQVTPNVKYVINCMEEKGNKLQITLYETNGSCGSGYCNASFGNYTVEWVDSFGGYTHTPNKSIEFSMSLSYDKWKKVLIAATDTDDIRVDDVFFVDETGGDDYYPNGTVWVNESLFTPNARYIEKPFVYIFHGESGTGKSYLSRALGNSEKYIVYETDSCDSLPKEIKAEIIVVGNKYKFELTDVKRRIPFDAQIIEVGFRGTMMNGMSGDSKILERIKSGEKISSKQIKKEVHDFKIIHNR